MIWEQVLAKIQDMTTEQNLLDIRKRRRNLFIWNIYLSLYVYK